MYCLGKGVREVSSLVKRPWRSPLQYVMFRTGLTWSKHRKAQTQILCSENTLLRIFLRQTDTQCCSMPREGWKMEDLCKWSPVLVPSSCACSVLMHTGRVIAMAASTLWASGGSHLFKGSAFFFLNERLGMLVRNSQRCLSKQLPMVCCHPVTLSHLQKLELHYASF